MKILALEHAVPGASPEGIPPLLRDEASKVWELHCAGVIREIYFRADRHEAVLMLECTDLAEAGKRLGDLPLVRARLIEFELLPLAPYDGFARLFTWSDNER